MPTRELSYSTDAARPLFPGRKIRGRDVAHVLLRGAQASQNERLHQRERGLAMLRILRQTLPLQRRVNQVNRAERILLGDQPTLHGLVEDADEDLTHNTRMIMQVRGALAGHVAA